MKFLVFALLVAGACAYTPISHEKAELVQSTWDTVKHNEVDILYAVFKAYPDIQAKFTQFAGKDLDSIKDTAPFATHAGRIVGFITEVVGLLGDEANQASIKQLLNEMGHNHKARGVTVAQFNEFRTALFSYLQAHVTWGDNVAAAWNQGVDNTYEVIFANL